MSQQDQIADLQRREEASPFAAHSEAQTAADRASGSPSRTAAGLGFNGSTVALFESRFAAEIARQVERQNGVALRAAALAETPIAVDDSVRAVIEQLSRGHFTSVVLLTGVGTRFLLSAAEGSGERANSVSSLRTARVICRGPKPAHALRQNHISVRHMVPEPHTTAALVRYLHSFDWSGERVLIVSAGERFEEPAASLGQLGAAATEVQLYEWTLTDENALLLETTIDLILSGRVQVAAFTTQVQVRYLFEVAERRGRSGELREALNRNVLVGSVGSTCEDSLLRHGVTPHVVPSHPRMGHLIVELARAWERRVTPAISIGNSRE